MLVFTAYRNGDDADPGEARVRHALDLGLAKPDEARARFLLGLAARTKGDEPRARAEFQASLAADPTHFPARLALS